MQWACEMSTHSTVSATRQPVQSPCRRSVQSACLDLRCAQRPRVLEACRAAQADEVLNVQRAAQALAQQHGVLADLRGGKGEQNLQMRTCKGGKRTAVASGEGGIGEANDSRLPPPLLAAVQVCSAVKPNTCHRAQPHHPAHLVGQAAVAVDVAEEPADGKPALAGQVTHVLRRCAGLWKLKRCANHSRCLLAFAWPMVASSNAAASPNRAPTGCLTSLRPQPALDAPPAAPPPCRATG